MIMLVFFGGCNSNRTSDRHPTDSLNTNREDPQLIEKSQSNDIDSILVEDLFLKDSTASFVNERFSADPFTKSFQEMVSILEKYDVEKKPYRNEYIEGQVDTILTVKFDDSTISYFKGKSSDFILSANIKSTKIEFKYGIHIGMNEDDLISVFKELNKYKGSFNKVTISDGDEQQSVELLFRNNKLNELRFSGYFD